MKRKIVFLLLVAIMTSCATTEKSYHSVYSGDGVYLIKSDASPYKPAKAAKKNTYKQMSTQCAATTKKGLRCSRTATPGSIYCWQHRR